MPQMRHYRTVLLSGFVSFAGAGAWAQTGGPADFLVDRLRIDNFEQTMIDLSTIPAFDGSPTPSRHYRQDGNTAAVAYIQTKLESFGYNNVVLDEYICCTGAPGPEFSIYATKVGSVDPTKMYIVSAHMDSFNLFDPKDAPGFDDDGSGTALVLELARVFVNTKTDVSIRFILWNNEETGLDGSEAYAADHAALQGTVDEPTWLGVIQHDMILFDHLPVPDADVEYQATSAFSAESEILANAVASAMARYGSMPAQVGNNMNFTDSKSFQDATAAISVRENQRVAEIGNGSNPHWHQTTDNQNTYTQADIEFGFNIVKMSAGAVAELVNAVPSPLIAPYPHDRRKNRYISFATDKANNDGKQIAFKVVLADLTLGSCGDTGGFCREDRKKCSGTPTPCTDNSDCPAPETCSVGADCNVCSTDGNPCISQPIDCAPGRTCDPTVPAQACSNDTPDAGGTNVGHVWWVGAESPLQNSVHLLVSEPFRKISTNWPSLVHVGDCEIVPEAVYNVRAVTATPDPMDVEIEATDSLLVETTRFATASSSWWGDCVGPLRTFCGGDIRNPVCGSDVDCTAPETCDRAWTLPDGSVNFDDVAAALALVAPGATSVAPDTTWVDVHGNATGTPGSQNFDPPNGTVNFPDIGQIIFGFGGFPYKGYDPADCPDTGTWP